MPKVPKLPLVWLFVALRGAALLLYLPGGVVSPAATAYPMLPTLPWQDPLLRQLIWGALLLGADALALGLLPHVARRSGERDSRERELAYVFSPLGLVAFLSSPVPFATVAVLLALLLFPAPRRIAVAIAFPVAFLTLFGGATLPLTALLLPLIIVTHPDSLRVSLLYSFGALLGIVLPTLWGLTGSALQWWQVVYGIALLPALAEWGVMLMPQLGWEKWRRRLYRFAVVAVSLLSLIGIFVVAPRTLRPALQASSPLAPILPEIAHASEGWFLTDDIGLYEQAVALSGTSLRSYVVSERNQSQLLTRLREEPAPVWVLQSNDPTAAPLLASVLGSAYHGDSTPLADGTVLRRYYSGADPLTIRMPLGALFSDNVTLVSASYTQQISAGSLLPLTLEWQGNLGEYTLFLHIVDTSSGTVVTQRDAPPLGMIDRHAITIPRDTMAGTYSMVLGRYDGDSGQRVPLQSGNDTVYVGEIIVVPPTP